MIFKSVKIPVCRGTVQSEIVRFSPAPPRDIKFSEAGGYSMPRIDLFIDTHVFYAFLKFKSKILADERDKRKMLDCILMSQGERPFCVLAFVLLDDEAHFLLGIPENNPGLAKCSVHAMLERCRGVCFPLSGMTDCFIEESYISLTRTEEVLNTCRQIHLLPADQGYVRSIRDYWWSSYQTYRGVYSWKCVDIFPLLHQLSEDTERGRQQLLQLHRRGKSTKIPDERVMV